MDLIGPHQFGDGVHRTRKALTDKFTVDSWAAIVLVSRQRVNAFDFRYDQLLPLLGGFKRGGRVQTGAGMLESWFS